MFLFVSRNVGSLCRFGDVDSFEIVMKLSPEQPVFTSLLLAMACLQGCGADASENASSTIPGADGTGEDSGVVATDAAEGADTADGASDGASGDTSVESPDVVVGSFLVQLVAPVLAGAEVEPRDGYTQVVGKVYDGPTPSQIVWEEAASAGACVLLVPRVPFCETPCGGSAICVEDNTCEPRPSAVSVGTVTMTGLRDASGPVAVTMDPIANNYQPVGVTLAYPAFDEGDDLKLTAAGAPDVPGFTITSHGIAPLELLSESFAIVAGAGMGVSWTPAAEAGQSSVDVLLDISHHGGSKGKIECETEDSGALSIDASLLGALTDLGVAGFPTIVVTRRAIGEAATATGRVQLAVSSRVEVAVAIDGLVSCFDDSDCSEGQTCQTDLVCR